MKRSYKFYAKLAAAALALTIGFGAYAGPREELAHAYVLLKLADHDYRGHRVKALHEIEVAGHELGIKLEGRGSEHEQQLKSDEQVDSAGRILRDVRNQMEEHDRERIAIHLDKAIEEVDLALKAR